MMDGHVKAEVGKAINELLAPMRGRRAEFEKPGGDDAIIDIIRAGVKKANATAEETLYMAKQAMKIDFGRRDWGLGTGH
jgi:tryptophanyl-tRNA synthetase